MSRAFLDTHVAYWLAQNPALVTDNLVRAVNSHSACAVSALSIAELEMKRMLGRATEIGDLHSRFESVGIAIEPFDYNAARAIARFPSLHNHDPFDRLILAHAASRPTTTFYTADTRLLNLGLDWVVDARA